MQRMRLQNLILCKKKIKGPLLLRRCALLANPERASRVIRADVTLEAEAPLPRLPFMEEVVPLGGGRDPRGARALGVIRVADFGSGTPFLVSTENQTFKK